MGGKPVFEIPATSSVINLESGFKEKLLCDGATFSTGVACVYSCSFCYVPDIQSLKPKHIALPHEAVVVRRANALAEIRRKLTWQSGPTKGNPKFIGPKEEGRVIYASPLVDVAANMELVRETVEACNIIMELTPWHIRLLSKSNLLPQLAKLLIERRREFWQNWCHGRDAAEEVRERVIFGVSTGTLNDRIASAFEAGTPLVSARIKSLRKLQDEGFRTFGMICPSLPMADEEYAPWAAMMAGAIRAEKCEHVWAEVINVRGESMRRTVEALRAAGYPEEAKRVALVSWDKGEWELYARATCEAHLQQIPPEKLRFLQYVDRRNEDYWRAFDGKGAVLL